MNCQLFPPVLKKLFDDEVEGSLLKDYLRKETKGDLTWIRKNFLESDFLEQKVTSVRFFTNPFLDEGLCVYAHLPGGLSLNQIDHCAPEKDSAGALLLLHDVFRGWGATFATSKQHL